MSVGAVVHRHAEGPTLVRKPTGWLTHSMEVAEALDRRCSGGHRHCNIFSGGAHTMRIIEPYPVRLVNAVLRALRHEVKKRARWKLDSTSMNMTCG